VKLIRRISCSRSTLISRIAKHSSHYFQYFRLIACLSLIEAVIIRSTWRAELTDSSRRNSKYSSHFPGSWQRHALDAEEFPVLDVYTSATVGSVRAAGMSMHCYPNKSASNQRWIYRPFVTNRIAASPNVLCMRRERCPTPSRIR